MKPGRRKLILFGLGGIALIGYYFSLPSKLFHNPYSTVLEDYQGALLTATIAADGQWRFPEVGSLPEKFAIALTTFEDKRFYSHPGVDPVAIVRAIQQNIKAGKIVSGGSTISMQVIRLSRKGKSRTIFEKLIEVVLATRLELRHSKEEILRMYASHAPFGGNVVGIEAACWRYFGREPASLSWAEAAMLAVLPNAPSLIHLGKNREKLKIKRDALLNKLESLKVIDPFTNELAKQEPIPDRPHTLPNWSKHLLIRAIKDGRSQQKLQTTINQSLQERVEQIINDHHERLVGNQIYNASALVLDVETGNVLAYVGNVNNHQGIHGDEVDVIAAPRSTGSILKPFLYAAMLDDGKILPATLLPDVPTTINGFAPKNFSHQYDGAVAADEALIRSLNVPAVHLLRDYRYERFYDLLKNMGMSTLMQPADHYGLSLILGGAEGTLWDITGMYASMARTLNHSGNFAGSNRYDKQDFRPPNYIHLQREEERQLQESSWVSAGTIYHTFEALKEVYRPGEETGWKYFSTSKKIAWKTGTSFGFRDGWAVGVTPRYAVGIWVGNADGEGRPGLTGTETAAPILFDVFSQLPADGWFQEPTAELVRVQVCKKSGHRVSDYCDLQETKEVIKAGTSSQVCPYHIRIHLSTGNTYRVHTACEEISKMNAANWFVLPPVQEYYYKAKNLSYKPIPEYRKDCIVQSVVASMELVYPKAEAKIFIPRELSGQSGSSVFELAHRNNKAIVYWHIDDQFMGMTQKVHQMAVQATIGRHKLTLVDNAGETLIRYFEVIFANVNN
jgi:penicillin-binding protein 1C